jgi:hypothetical protein
VGFLLPLLLEDSPADELGRHFSDVRQALTREEPPMTVEDQCSAAGRIVDLFEAVCRMDAGAR